MILFKEACQIASLRGDLPSPAVWINQYSHIVFFTSGHPPVWERGQMWALTEVIFPFHNGNFWDLLYYMAS